MLRIQPDCQTSAHPTRDFAKADYMPTSKAVRPQSNQPRTKNQPVMGRLSYNQKIWGSERTSSERGLSGLQSEDTSFTASCCQPYPNNAGKNSLAPTAINYSSKLMSAAQELFQLFSQGSRFVDDKTRVAEGLGLCKRFG